ncbi:hypothetical protein [Streptomyces sp. NPDC006309]|uniref:hypothetical protein n=1 Tax=Streptomyces sp. NPDC006309 TaxID=3156749 RepID=UPI0033ACA875
MLGGKPVRLRALRADDLDAQLRRRNDPEAAHWATGGHPYFGCAGSNRTPGAATSGPCAPSGASASWRRGAGGPPYGWGSSGTTTVESGLLREDRAASGALLQHP